MNKHFIGARSLALSSLVISVLLFSAPAWAEMPKDRIQKACTTPAQNSHKQGSSFSLLIEDVRRKFGRADARIANPRGFVASLDNVIAQSSFASTLKCRENLQKFGLVYHLRFLEPTLGEGSMYIQSRAVIAISPGVDPEEIANPEAVTLYFDLNKSVEKVFFVYLHELTHVCQAPNLEHLYVDFQKALGKLSAEKRAAWKNFESSEFTEDPFPPELKQVDEARGNLARALMYGEIEAFYKMQLAYRDWVPQAPALCYEANQGPRDSPLYMAYVNTETQLSRGFFAQSKLAAYDTPADIRHYAYATNSPLHRYPKLDPEPGEEKEYSRPSMHPKLKARIEKLGILVREP